MHVLLWHGYLLRGTGSNIYVRNVAAQLVRAGHRVSLFCQERKSEAFSFVDRAFDLAADNGALAALFERSGTGTGSCSLYRPHLAGHLPVYVWDRYEGFDQVTEMPDLSDAELKAYVQRNVTALRTVFADDPPDLAITNHAVASPCVVRRALGDGVTRVSVLHGSALNYSVRMDERLLHLAAEGLTGAAKIVVVSPGAAEAVHEVLGGHVPDLGNLITVVPCGVDDDLFCPMETEEALEKLSGALQGPFGLTREADERARQTMGAARDEEDVVAAADGIRGTYDERKPDEAALEKVRGVVEDGDGLVCFAGKLIVSKGPQALLLALPRLFANTEASALFVGFGTFREGLCAWVQALDRGDLKGLKSLVALGRRLEGGERGGCPEAEAFLDDLEGEGRLEEYLELARTSRFAERVVFTGVLPHPALCRIFALSDLAVVPSIFPEAFGMVGAEAMACGTLPVMTDQGGLGDLIRLIGLEVGEDVARTVAVDSSPGKMVRSLEEALAAAFELARSRTDLADDLRAISVARFGWVSVCERLLDPGADTLDGAPSGRRPS